MGENACYKFGTPHSADLQKLQEICINITNTDTNVQKFLLFLSIAFSLFLILVLFAKIFTSDKKIINAYYKSAFTYYIQIFTVITVIPLALFFFEAHMSIVSKLVVTAGIFGMIFVIYEYWPIYKKEPEVNNSIISTIFLVLFTLSFYQAYSLGINSSRFIDTALVSVLMAYLMILNIFIKLAIEVKRKSEEH